MFDIPHPESLVPPCSQSLPLCIRVDPCPSVVGRIRPRTRVPTEPRLPRPCRGVPVACPPKPRRRREGPSAPPPIAPFLCNSKVIRSKGLSAPISPLESALANSRAIFRISLKTNGRQVLYNQHLRIFSPQPLWNQHLHKNTGVGGIACRAVVQSLPAATSAEALAEAEALAKAGSPIPTRDEGIAGKRRSES